MVSVVLLGIYLILILYHCYKYCTYRPPNFPPGPPRIPLFGAYLILLFIDRHNLHLAALKLSKWYKSKVIGFYIGNTPTIVGNDKESVREILFNTAFDGRPDVFVARMRDPHHELRGIFFTEGPMWKEQRRFTLRHLRDYGFGRRFDSLEHHCREEITAFIDTVRYGPKFDHEMKYFRENGQVNLPKATFACLGNCFLQVLFDERIPRHDQRDLFKAGDLGLLFQRTGDDYGKLLSVTPWIRFLFPEASGYNTFKETNPCLFNFMKDLIDKQIRTHDPAIERNFIDLYIKEMKETKEANEFGFIHEQLVLTCLDFFFPALTAVGTQVAFLFQFLLKYPNVKQKVQQEIDDIVGNGRLPNLDDRMYLPYTEATIREVLRFETLVPSSIPHKAIHSTKFFGYDVPQGTFMIPTLYALHTDQAVWGDPFNFRPERFIDIRGQLSLKKDVSLPFGAGKRLCAGETFARNTLFLFTAAMLQNFDFKIVGDTNVEELISKNMTGLIRTTPDFWMEFSPR